MGLVLLNSIIFFTLAVIGFLNVLSFNDLWYFSESLPSFYKILWFGASYLVLFLTETATL